MSDQEELDYYNSKLEEDDFNDIVDPETNRTVPNLFYEVCFQCFCFFCFSTWVLSLRPFLVVC